MHFQDLAPVSHSVPRLLLCFSFPPIFSTLPSATIYGASGWRRFYMCTHSIRICEICKWRSIDGEPIILAPFQTPIPTPGVCIDAVFTEQIRRVVQNHRPRFPASIRHPFLGNAPFLSQRFSGRGFRFRKAERGGGGCSASVVKRFPKRTRSSRRGIGRGQRV